MRIQEPPLYTRPEISKALEVIQARDTIANQDRAFHIAARLRLGYSAEVAVQGTLPIDDDPEKSRRYVETLAKLHTA